MTDFAHIAKLLRYYVLLSSTTATSGHATSSLSAADLMSVLYFNHFRYDFNNPQNLANDRLIFSKGHASPLLYSLYKLAGQITEQELLQYRKKASPLQGHPTPDTPFVDVATGSLGMGLSYGLGMSLALQKHFPKAETQPKVYVLLGDGEMAEGQNWEAIQLASHYQTNNLIGILDVNRLAETGETMIGHDIHKYANRFAAFDWDTKIIDGHNIAQIDEAYTQLQTNQTKPTMIIAKTIKGQGISFLEDQLNKHGKALKPEEFKQAIEELEISISHTTQTFEVKKPASQQSINYPENPITVAEVRLNINNSLLNNPQPTRQAYGLALSELAKIALQVIVMDGDLSDSTFSGLVEKETPDQFLNMFIAEQNMVSTAVGLSKLGFKPFVSTFSAFLTRAYDQIRLASLSQVNIVICGSHGGVSVGEDGPSGMGLEDIAMLRPVHKSTILYPSDAISMTKMVELAYQNENITYIRSTRPPTPLIYDSTEAFTIGGSKTLKSNAQDQVAIVTAGITVHEALKAHQMLSEQGISVRVIDLYSIKPLDRQNLLLAAQACPHGLLTIEDHSIHGGLGDAVLDAFTGLSLREASDNERRGNLSALPRILKLGITTLPHSATPSQNLESHGLSAQNIYQTVLKMIK